MNHIGKRIRQACEIIEAHGPCGYLIVAQTAGTLKPNACKAVARAVKFGLMTVKSPDHRGNSGDCNIYTVVPDWRNVIAERAAKKINGIKPLKAGPTYQRVNSVFALGAF